MGPELKAFLEKIASRLNSRMDRLRAEFRAEILEAEAPLNARLDGVGRLALHLSRSGWLRSKSA